MKNILFISWDSPQTNYMDGLFLPIFNEIQNQSNYTFHVIQFTWKTENQIAIIKEKAEDYSIFYKSHQVYRVPNVTLGSIYTIKKGITFIKNYIQKNDIDVVMPRSIMPAIMVNRIKNKKFEIVYDADGLPIEERVDFLQLSTNSMQYKFLKKEELKILTAANRIITRTKKAISIHLDTIGEQYKDKFYKVINGRNSSFFKPSDIARSKVRKELNIPENAKLFIYSGSLGTQYCWTEMISIFQTYHEENKNSFFLILSGNHNYANKRIPQELKNYVHIKNVAFEEMPKYLSAADIAFALREPKFSMQGVAPIKLGEYLLMGLPVIASKGIGDTEDILKKAPNCFIYDHESDKSFVKSIQFINQTNITHREEIRAFGIKSFSLDKSAKSYIKTLNSLS